MYTQFIRCVGRVGRIEPQQICQAACDKGLDTSILPEERSRRDEVLADCIEA